jgi:hypothetical protein
MNHSVVGADFGRDALPRVVCGELGQARTHGVRVVRQAVAVNDADGLEDADRVDLFVSHAGRDRARAEWVAWELQQAGYRVELDFWDWEVGENFVDCGASSPL